MIYPALLKEDFSRLHPKLQERYSLPLNEPFRASGVMQVIQSGPKYLRPLYLLFTATNFLFPEHGTNVPFSITNTCYINDENIAEVYWQRDFHFSNATRHFNAKMTADLDNGIVKDYLGDPALFYSDLLFNVTTNGELLIRSNAQRVMIGNKELPLSRKLTGRVVVTEGYDDIRNVYTIHVSIYNDIFGRMMMYAGEFTPCTN